MFEAISSIDVVRFSQREQVAEDANGRFLSETLKN